MLSALKRAFTESAKALRDTRTLTRCAMLLALQIALGLVSDFYLTPDLRISFGFIPQAMTGYLFGPVPAMISGALADVIGYLIKPTAAYHPGLTLSAVLGGLVYGSIFYRRWLDGLRVVQAKLIVDVFINILLNTFWLQQILGRAFMLMLPGRIIKNMAMLPVDVMLLMLVLPTLKRVAKPLPEWESAPPGRHRRALAVLCIVLAVVGGVWANNTSLNVKRTEEPKLLAHRGLAQTFEVEGVAWDTDTSKIIHPIEHEYIENTIPSMQEAFRLGAAVVELDVRRTKDDKLAVFHDYTIEYRTDGEGLVSDHTMAELKLLDVGYGYTADGGKTWPLRGKGVGQMPSLDEVLEVFPEQDLLIHLKDEDERAGDLLAGYLQGMDEQRLARISVYGSDAGIEQVKQEVPTLRAMSMSSLKTALIQYELLGWTGYIPPAMQNTQIHLPMNYARLLWGWPARFVSRMDSVGTRVVLVNGDGGASEGFDDIEQVAQIPSNYTGYIWTNRIDRIGEAFE